MSNKSKVRILTPAERASVEREVKMMLHASRDCYRNQKQDTSRLTYPIADGYYGESFGVMRGLAVLGYGQLNGPSFPRGDDRNLKGWFAQLCDEVLTEENYGGNDQCDHCLERYGKDGAGRKRG